MNWKRSKADTRSWPNLDSLLPRVLSVLIKISLFKSACHCTMYLKAHFIPLIASHLTFDCLHDFFMCASLWKLIKFIDKEFPFKHILSILKVFGTVKPKANQVRGSRTKESFRDFLGPNFIIHRIPDGKDFVQSYVSILPWLYVFYRDDFDYLLCSMALQCWRWRCWFLKRKLELKMGLNLPLNLSQTWVFKPAT